MSRTSDPRRRRTLNPSDPDPSDPGPHRPPVHVHLNALARRLSTALAAVELAYANLVAAGRATLLADADGEPDPLSYLRDELPPAPPGHPLADPRPDRR